jgi:hypothetical protein
MHGSSVGPAPGSVAATAWRASPPLVVCAVVSIALAGAVAVGLALDPRTLDGVPVWLKPLKFGVSNALFAFTLAWMLAWLDDRPRLVARAGWGVALALTLENVLIPLQAWRGVHSHFNATTPLDAAIVSLMGAAIVAAMVLAASVARALFKVPAADARLRAARLGLTIAIAGASIGGLMGVHTREQLSGIREGAVLGGHTVGAADGGPGLPVTGWSQSHGDLRVPHFAGLHAMQVLPLLGWAIARRRYVRARQVALVRAAAGGYAALVGILLWQALRGEPVSSPGAATLLALGVAMVALAVALLPADRSGSALEGA